jgi:hypothetical protein
MPPRRRLSQATRRRALPRKPRCRLVPSLWGRGATSQPQAPLSARQRTFRTGLAKLIGRRIEQIEALGEEGEPWERKGAPTVVLHFTGGPYVVLADWRLLVAGRLQVTSREHNERYGLPHPIDAVGELRRTLDGADVKRVELDESTGDIWVTTDACKLQVLNLYRGFECWHVSLGDGTGEYSNTVWSP